MAKFKKYQFDPIKDLDLNIPKDRQREALQAASEFLKETMLDYIGDGKFTVSGGKWVKSLSPEYKKKKLEESGIDYSNLELTGSFLDNLSVEAKGSKIVIDVDPDDYGRAEGFITGQYGDSSKIKKRQFMPQPGEEFRKEILNDLRSLLEEFEEEVQVINEKIKNISVKVHQTSNDNFYFGFYFYVDIFQINKPFAYESND